MYEHRRQRLLTRTEFAIRVLRHVGISLAAVAVALGMGVAGYHYFDELGWLDSLLNASMILGGMGPVNPMTTAAAKLFASFYALFSGLVFVGLIAILLAPFVHRLIHRFHLEEDED